jgi:transposase
MYPGEFL